MNTHAITHKFNKYKSLSDKEDCIFQVYEMLSSTDRINIIWPTHSARTSWPTTFICTKEFQWQKNVNLIKQFVFFQAHEMFSSSDRICDIWPSHSARKLRPAKFIICTKDSPTQLQFNIVVHLVGLRAKILRI